MARRLLTRVTGSLHMIEIDLAPSGYPDFWAWRVEVRNFVDYRRRGDRRWRDTCMSVWLSADGHVRGIIGLGSLIPAEVLAAFHGRWPTTLCSISPADLLREITAVIDPAVIAAPPSSHGRYQHVKFSIWPQQRRAKAASLFALRPLASYVEPMPVLI